MEWKQGAHKADIVREVSGYSGQRDLNGERGGNNVMSLILLILEPEGLPVYKKRIKNMALLSIQKGDYVR